VTKLLSVFRVSQGRTRDLRKIVLWFALPIFFFPGCFAGQKIKIKVKPSVKIKLNEVKELAPVHVIHRGKKMEPDMEVSVNSLDCYYCHIGEVSKRRKGVPAMSLCKGCHTGRNAPDLSCEQCHMGQKRVFSGIKGSGLKTIKSSMADLDCVDCHDTENELRVSTGVCEDCHEDSNMYKMSRLQKEYSEKVAGIEGHFNKINNYTKVVKRKQKTLIDIDKFKIGNYNYKYALLDRSKGVHNPEFVMRLLDKAEKTIFMLSAQYNKNARKLIQQAQAENINIRRKALMEIETVGGEQALLPFLNDPSSGLHMEAKAVLINYKTMQDHWLRKRRSFVY
jgi:hypothetical protein